MQHQMVHYSPCLCTKHQWWWDVLKKHGSVSSTTKCWVQIIRMITCHQNRYAFMGYSEVESWESKYTKKFKTFYKDVQRHKGWITTSWDQRKQQEQIYKHSHLTVDTVCTTWKQHQIVHYNI